MTCASRVSQLHLASVVELVLGLGVRYSLLIHPELVASLNQTLNEEERSIGQERR